MGNCGKHVLWLLVIDSGKGKKHKLDIFPAVTGLAFFCCIDSDKCRFCLAHVTLAICIGLVALEAMDGMTSQGLGL